MEVVNKTDLTETGERNLRKIIKLVIPDEICRQILPYSEAYCKAEENLSLFQELLPEYKDRINANFCRSFVNFVLPDYVKKIQMASEPQYQPKYTDNIDKARVAILFHCYSCRAYLLDNLHSLFFEKQKSELDLSSIESFTLLDKVYTASKYENEIVAAIRAYFNQIDFSLGNDSRDYLVRRVQWASKMRLQNDTLRPALFLYMVISCKGNLVSGRDIRIPKQTAGPWYSGTTADHPRQRTAQLILLDKLCGIFQLSQEDRIKNMNLFLFWQGKEIQSIAKLNYWQEQLSGDYTRIPIIGFQLCCRDYMRDCLSPHFEDLSYTTASPLHLGGYVAFWNDNQEVIQKQTKSLGMKYPALVTEYKKLWKNPCKYFYDSVQWLEEHLEADCKIALEEFRYSDEYNESELSRLILESEFRLCICSQARSRLIKMCESTCNLKPVLFAEFE